MKCIIITTIFPPRNAIPAFLKTGYDVIIVGDEKTPEEYASIPGVTYLDIPAQDALSTKLSLVTPRNHYARKNLGYLFALRKGYSIIGESDDDNIPYDGWGADDTLAIAGSLLLKAPRFPNIYSLYTDVPMWPRGFPLDQLTNSRSATIVSDEVPPNTAVFVWQGLADGEPDIDAVFRLTSPEYCNDGSFAFAKNGKKYVLSSAVLSPLNSQNTIWVDSRAFPFLYLPVTVDPRVSDILRSYVLQYCLRKLGGHVGFHQATVYQERNEHNLLKDFAAEVPIYVSLSEMLCVLDKVNYRGHPDDLLSVYLSLANAGFVSHTECESVSAWLSEVCR